MGKAFGVRSAVEPESVICPVVYCLARKGHLCITKSSKKWPHGKVSKKAHPERVSAAIKARQEREAKR